MPLGHFNKVDEMAIGQATPVWSRTYIRPRLGGTSGLNAAAIAKGTVEEVLRYDPRASHSKSGAEVHRYPWSG